MDSLNDRILLTIELLSRKLIVPEIEEVYSFLILQGYEARVTKDDCRVIIDNLDLGQKIVKRENFVSLADHNIKEDIKSREIIKKETEQKFVKLQSQIDKLNNIFNIDLLLARRNYFDGTYEFYYISKGFKFKKIFNLLIRMNSINIHKGNMIEYETKEIEGKTIINGLNILNSAIIINKDNTFEKFLNSNKWIFNIFKNYELKNITDSIEG